jgi:outer membrane protein TolC
MNRSVDAHEPTPEFRAHLDWQIETALRRDTRFAAPAGGGLRRIGTALLVIAALATGGMAGVASTYAQEARERDRLVESARSEVALVQLRLDLARTEYQNARGRFEIGAADRETLMAAEQKLHAMEAALARLKLNIEEIKATSAAPRNDLQAPLVGRRDFVRERLTLDLDAAERALTTAEQSAAQAEQRFQVGVAPRAALLQAQADVSQARARLQLLRATLDMRQRALRKEIKPEDLAAAARRIELTLHVEQLERELDLGHARLDEARRLVAVGQASELDLKRAELDLLERQHELMRVRQELQRLGAVKR